MATRVSRRKAEADWKVGLVDNQPRDVPYKPELCRYFDERSEVMHRQGRLPGAIYSGRGQEGTDVGVVDALRRDDSLFPTHHRGGRHEAVCLVIREGK